MIRRTLALVALLVAAPSLASAADESGPAGYVTHLQVNTTSGLAYLTYHGRMFIQEAQDGKKNGPAIEAEYRWGGLSCGSRTLTEGQVTMLMRAMDSGLRVAPLYDLGQGASKCVVGFNIIP